MLIKVSFCRSDEPNTPKGQCERDIQNYFCKPATTDDLNYSSEFNILKGKIDALTASVEMLTKKVTENEKGARQSLGPLLSLEKRSIEETLETFKGWSDAANIAELIVICPRIQWFPGNEQHHSVLRCNTCFEYLTRENKCFSKEAHSAIDALQTARKGIGR